MQRIDRHPTDLKKLPPFSWFEEPQLSRALSAVQRREYASRVVIQQAGSTADGLYLLLAGRVQIVHHNAEGREFIAGTVGPHDFFGELGLFEGEKCIASIRSSQPCQVLYIPRPMVLLCLSTIDHAAMFMLQKVATRLGTCHRKLAEIALTNVYQRIARAMIENTSEAEREAILPFGAEELARRVGASREMVSRVVRGMVDQGLVRRHKKQLLVLNRQALMRRLGH